MRKQLLVGVSLVALCGCTSRIDAVMHRAAATPYWAAAYVPSEGSTMAAALTDLEARLLKGGVTVARVEGLPPLGVCFIAERRILLRASLAIDAQFEVLAHEAGHLLQSPAIPDRSTAEVFAELVGVEIQAYYKSKTSRQTASGYLPLHKHAFAAVPAMRADIQHAARIILGFQPWPTKGDE